MKNVYHEEKGKIDIQGQHMRWILKRSQGESCFGIEGSRIFELEIYKNDVLTLKYGYGYSTKPDQNDQETKLCKDYLIDKYGRNRRKKKKK